MAELDQENDKRSMMKTDYGDNKADKSSELNDSMTIQEQGADEYEQTAKNLGGQQ